MIKATLTYIYRSYHRHILLPLLNKYVGVEFLDQIKAEQTPFERDCPILSSHWQNMRVVVAVQSLPLFGFVSLFNLSRSSGCIMAPQCVLFKKQFLNCGKIGIT